MLAKFYFNRGAFAAVDNPNKIMDCFQLSGWHEVRPLKSLPKTYTKEMPIFYEIETENLSDQRHYQKGIMVVWCENGRIGSTTLTKGSILTEPEFQHFRKIVKVAGKRLTGIMKTERNSRKRKYACSNSVTVSV